MVKLFTDTDTDITLEEARKYGYELISMPYLIGDKETFPYEDFEVFDYKTFYDQLRAGTLPKTSAISPMKYMEYFEKEFAKGNDILYVHFSRAMSGTFNAMDIAYQELLEKYPERKLYTIDTKGITILSNIIVKEIGDMYLEGKTVEEILAWAEEEIDHFATYFFADNLNFFKRSGRVNNVSAAMGNLIGLKPILYMNEAGTMTNIGKERGRYNALRKLVEYVDDLNVDIQNHRVVVGHSDALELAQKLGTMLMEKYGTLNIDYVVVNPTAGSHCGPDTIGVAFYAKHK
jgi:DegV family protein with EDD domain